MSVKNHSVLEHMIEHCERLNRYCDRCPELDNFMNDELLQDGMTMQLLSLGELTTHLTEEFKAAHPEMDWRNIKQLRNVCAHRYGTIDYKLIWDIVHVDIPKIRAFCDEQLALYEMLTQPAVEEEYDEEL